MSSTCLDITLDLVREKLGDSKTIEAKEAAIKLRYFEGLHSNDWSGSKGDKLRTQYNDAQTTWNKIMEELRRAES